MKHLYRTPFKAEHCLGTWSLRASRSVGIKYKSMGTEYPNRDCGWTILFAIAKLRLAYRLGRPIL